MVLARLSGLIRERVIRSASQKLSYESRFNPYRYWNTGQSCRLRSAFSSLQQCARTTGYTITETAPEDVLSKPGDFDSMAAFFVRHCISSTWKEFDVGVDLTKFFSGLNE